MFICIRGRISDTDVVGMSLLGKLRDIKGVTLDLGGRLEGPGAGLAGGDRLAGGGFFAGGDFLWGRGEVVPVGGNFKGVGFRRIERRGVVGGTL